MKHVDLNEMYNVFSLYFSFLFFCSHLDFEINDKLIQYSYTCLAHNLVAIICCLDGYYLKVFEPQTSRSHQALQPSYDLKCKSSGVF